MSSVLPKQLPQIGQQPHQDRTTELLSILGGNPLIKEVINQARSSITEKRLGGQVDARECYKRSVESAGRAIAQARTRGILVNANSKFSSALDLNRVEFQTFSVRGSDHFENQQPCQDRVVCHRLPEAIVAVVSDGAGAVPLSHIGAELLTQESIAIMEELLAGWGENRSLIDPYLLGSLHLGLVSFMQGVNRELQISDFDAYRLFWAATLQIAIVTKRETLVVALGDGFLKWQGSYAAIEQTIGRSEELCSLNYPPLLASQIGLNRSIPSLFSSSDSRLKQELFSESCAFSIVAYGPSSEVLASDLVLASDGLRFAPELGYRPDSWNGLILEGLLKKFGSDEAEQLLLLMGLVAAPVNSKKANALLGEILRFAGNGSGPAAQVAAKMVTTVCSSQVDFADDFGTIGRISIGNSERRSLLAFAQDLLSNSYGIKIRRDFEGLWDDLALIRLWIIARPLQS